MTKTEWNDDQKLDRRYLESSCDYRRDVNEENEKRKGKKTFSCNMLINWLVQEISKAQLSIVLLLDQIKSLVRRELKVNQITITCHNDDDNLSFSRSTIYRESTFIGLGSMD